tara:strand:+ start:6987 stop:7658 length:672 start_codon:yes stop_codon:yes gene_type:complete
MIRFFDILFSSLAILILSPLFIVVILILRFTGEGEIFFLQDRMGMGHKKIKIFKFVTMRKNSSQIGGNITIKDDPRILPVGNFLRKTKINELPQLFNIFLGSMSVIGPRPQTISCFEAFPKESQEKITMVKPGLSGIGSVIFRSEEEILDNQEENLNFYNNIIAPYKGKVETWFVNNVSVSNYFLLIFITVIIIALPKSQIVWKIFKDLPEPPAKLKKLLNYS